MSGGSQLPLTQVQLVPGLAVVQLDVDVVGSRQLPVFDVLTAAAVCLELRLCQNAWIRGRL
jgi:hypothetical protein